MYVVNEESIFFILDHLAYSSLVEFNGILGFLLVDILIGLKIRIVLGKHKGLQEIDEFCTDSIANGVRI